MIPLFRPLDEWRLPEPPRRHSQFSASYSDTMQLLERELSAVRARDAVICVVADERAVRLDGRLRADAKVRHPGVMLEFTHPDAGRLVYSCAKFYAGFRGPTTNDWQHNLRAIALGLEALRKVDRYGITDRGQQYAGFRELGSGGPIAMGPDRPFASAEEAAEFLARLACDAFGDDWIDGEALLVGSPAERADLLRGAYRDAARLVHPDATTGDAETFRRATIARDMLDALLP